jgi:hypothetical protein
LAVSPDVRGAFLNVVGSADENGVPKAWTKDPIEDNKKPRQPEG